MDDPIVEGDIQDVSLVNTPDIPAQDNSTSDPPAAPAKEDGAEVKDGEQTEPQASGDAKDTEATAPQEQPTAPDDAAKADRDRAAREAYLNRQRTRQQVEQQLDQGYGPKTAEEFQDEGLNAAEAQIAALRAEMAYEKQRTQIAEMNAGLQAEAVNVINDFNVFNPKSPDYDPDFTKEVEAAYKTAARIQTDEETGIILNAEVPLYPFYQRMARIYTRGAARGGEQAQQQTLQMMSRTEDIGSSSTVSKGEESLAEMEARLGDAVIT
jgi:hypothetical protein